MGRFMREVEHGLDKFRKKQQQQQPTNNSIPLKFNFVDCAISANDVKELEARLKAESVVGENQPPLLMAFACCKLAGDGSSGTEISPTARVAHEEAKEDARDEKKEDGAEVVASGGDSEAEASSTATSALAQLKAFLSSHVVESLDFSVTYMEPEEVAQLVAAARPKVLHLTLRYKQNVQMPLAALCPDDETDAPRRLEALHLDARQPMESRIRLARMQELGVVLPLLAKQHKRLRQFTLTSCEFDDEGFGLLVGGLLALRETLEHVHLQNVKGELSSASLVYMGYLFTDLPKLQHLHLDLQNGHRRKLLHGARLPQIKDWTAALALCAARHVRLELSHVGLTSTTSGAATFSKLLHAVSVAKAGQVSLRLADGNFVQQPALLHQLVQHLPRMTKCTALSLVDTAATAARVQQDDDKAAEFQAMATQIASALERNTGLEQFAIHGNDNANLLEETAEQRIAAILQRNVHLGRVRSCLAMPQHQHQAMKTSDQTLLFPSGLWPHALVRILRDGCDQSPIFFMLQRQIKPWLNLYWFPSDNDNDENEADPKAGEDSDESENGIPSPLPLPHLRDLRNPIPMQKRQSEESFQIRQKRIEDTLNFNTNSNEDDGDESSESTLSSTESGWDTSSSYLNSSHGDEDDDDHQHEWEDNDNIIYSHSTLQVRPKPSGAAFATAFVVAPPPSAAALQSSSSSSSIDNNAISAFSSAFVVAPSRSAPASLAPGNETLQPATGSPETQSEKATPAEGSGAPAQGEEETNEVPKAKKEKKKSKANKKEKKKKKQAKKEGEQDDAVKEKKKKKKSSKRKTLSNIPEEPAEGERATPPLGADEQQATDGPKKVAKEKPLATENDASTSSVAPTEPTSSSQVDPLHIAEGAPPAQPREATVSLSAFVSHGNKHQEEPASTKSVQTKKSKSSKKSSTSRGSKKDSKKSASKEFISLDDDVSKRGEAEQASVARSNGKSSKTKGMVDEAGDTAKELKQSRHKTDKPPKADKSASARKPASDDANTVKSAATASNKKSLNDTKGNRSEHSKTSTKSKSSSRKKESNSSRQDDGPAPSPGRSAKTLSEHLNKRSGTASDAKSVKSSSTKKSKRSSTRKQTDSKWPDDVKSVKSQDTKKSTRSKKSKDEAKATKSNDTKRKTSENGVAATEGHTLGK